MTESFPNTRSPARTVLLVEDDRAVRQSFRDALVCHGFVILEATSGDEALSLVVNSRETIEVAIVDMAMSPMWGDELARRMAIVSPKTQVIFVSGHSEDFLRSMDSLTGDYIFYPKPVAPKVLAEKIRELLGILPRVSSSAAQGAGCPSPDSEPEVHSHHFVEHLKLHIESDQRVD